MLVRQNCFQTLHLYLSVHTRITSSSPVILNRFSLRFWKRFVLDCHLISEFAYLPSLVSPSPGVNEKRLGSLSWEQTTATPRYFFTHMATTIQSFFSDHPILNRCLAIIVF